MIKNHYYLIILSLNFLPGCKKNIPNDDIPSSENTSPVSILPKNLLYNNKPISDDCMKELSPILCEATEFTEIDLDTYVAPQNQIYMDNQKDEYEWNYIGTLPNGNHLIYTYLWPAGAMGKFSQITIIQRTANKLRAIPLITGGSRHATMITAQSCHLNGNTLKYYQHMTNGLLYETLMEEYPELSDYTKHKNNDELYWGEADYLGYGTFEVTLTPEGNIKNKRLISFTLATGDLNNVVHPPQEKSSLTMGNAINSLLNYYSYIHEKDTFTPDQLKKIMMEACSYAQ